MATTLGYHLNFHLADRRVIARSPIERRAAARSILRIGETTDGLLAFRVADTHVHIEVACERRAAGRLAQRVGSSLRRLLKLPSTFAPAHLEPVRNQRHLIRTFHYVLGQEKHHGSELDPLHEASNLPDLLGLRLLGRFTANSVATLLPRVNREGLLAHFSPPLARALGTARPSLEDAPLFEAALLLDAAAAAFALPTAHASGRSAARAKRAVVQLAGRRCEAWRMGELLRLAPRTIHRYRNMPIDDEAVAAVHGQLRLRIALTQMRRTNTADYNRAQDAMTTTMLLCATVCA